MKLGSLVCIGAAALALPLCAADFELTGTDNQVLGWMKIVSTAKNTIIAVPWLAVEGGDVAVADYINKATLSEGDALYSYDAATGKWAVFKLNADKSAWVAQTTADENGPQPVPGAESVTLARGKAVFLQRQNTSSAIYVYGKYDTSAVSATVAAGTEAAPAYTLIANPNDSDFDLNASGVWTTAPANGDKITVNGEDGSIVDTYEYNATTGKWEHDVVTTKYGMKVKKRSTEGCKVAAGLGVWYVSIGNAAAQLTWAAAAN